MNLRHAAALALVGWYLMVPYEVANIRILETGHSLRPSPATSPVKKQCLVYVPTHMDRLLSISPNCLTEKTLMGKSALLRFGRKRTLLASRSNQNRAVPLLFRQIKKLALLNSDSQARTKTVPARDGRWRDGSTMVT